MMFFIAPAVSLFGEPVWCLRWFPTQPILLANGGTTAALPAPDPGDALEQVFCLVVDEAQHILPTCLTTDSKSLLLCMGAISLGSNKGWT